jgi:hypothetical protein
VIDVPAVLAEWLLFGVEGGRPEGDARVEVVNVDDEVAQPAAVCHADVLRSMRSWRACPTVTKMKTVDDLVAFWREGRDRLLGWHRIPTYAMTHTGLSSSCSGLCRKPGTSL